MDASNIEPLYMCRLSRRLNKTIYGHATGEMPAFPSAGRRYQNSGAWMTQTQKHSDPYTSDSFSSPITFPFVARPTGTPYRKVVGKMSRFLARNVPTKKLTMRNTQPMVTFTFDDVPATACDLGVRLLERHGALGTFYVAGGGCERNSPVGLLASIDQLRAVYSKGHEIGCQTFSHVAVSSLSRGELDLEYSRNQSALKRIDGNLPVRNFSYPYGDLSFRARLHLETLFDSCRSIDPGINAGLADLGLLKSCTLDNRSIDRAEISRLIADTVRINGWLIFLSHDVCDEPSRFGIQPDLLEFALHNAQQAGLQPVTISQALRIARGIAPGGHTT
jgi:peptidoglycan/xylan/chitin deacetylase (PgdA/CDA1 family)